MSTRTPVSTDRQDPVTSSHTAPSPAAAAASGAPLRASHYTLAVLALAMGGFAIGTTEFVSMGLLPEIAGGLDRSISVTGHLISAYAVGVVVGAPLLAYFGAGLPRRALLLALMAVFVVGNLASAVVASYDQMLLARFFAGVPHGAYFGVASLVAASLADPERRGRAVASVMLGLSFANVVGVPAATWLGQNLGWRSAYWLVGALGLVTIALIAVFIPRLPTEHQASGRQELGALRNAQVWLTLLAGAGGFGGMFAVYTYISPTVTDVGGLGDGAVPVFLLAFGLGMVAGTWVAGVLADWSNFRSLLIGSVGMGGMLLLFWAASPGGWLALPVVFGVSVLSSVLVVNLQLRLMRVAGEAQTLGAALNHASLNMANALGAWLGGVVIAAGHGYRSPAIVGVGLSVLGLVVLLASGLLERRAATSPATPQGH